MASPVQIICVPPALFSEVWAYYGGFLLRGLNAAADVGCIETIDRIKDGEHLWWIITRDGERLGAFCTQIFESRGGRMVGIYALAGIGAKEWIGDVNKRMAEYAAAEKCAAYQFCGKPAWKRLLPECAVIGERQPGVAIFEGAPA